MVLAARFRLTASQPWEQRRHDPFFYTLIAGTGVLASHPPRAQRLAQAALLANNIEIVEHDPVVEMGPRELRLRSGRCIPCDAALVSTKAKPPAWFADTGLAGTRPAILHCGQRCKR